MSKNKNQAAASQVEAATSQTPNQSAAAEQPKAKAKKQNPMVEFFTPLIAEGKYTQKELFEKAIESKNFEKLAESTIRTLLTDSKNPKYNRFSKLVVKGEGGKLSFAE